MVVVRSDDIRLGSADEEISAAGATGLSGCFPTPNASSVPSWVYDVNLPDRLVRCLVAAHRFAQGGRWRADMRAAKTLAITDRTLRTWTSALARAGFVTKVGRATYELKRAAA